MEAGLSLGSNQGDRLALLKTARDRLRDLPDAVLAAQSAVYLTEPVDVRPEHARMSFLNAVLIMESARDPAAWLQATRRIEAEMGRKRDGGRNAPRPIDIDILYVGGESIEQADLVVPHPRWLERAFVVCPLAQVRPNLRLPHCPLTVHEVLDGLNTRGVEIFRRSW